MFVERIGEVDDAITILIKYDYIIRCAGRFDANYVVVISNL